MTPGTSGYQAYRRTQIETAPPGAADSDALRRGDPVARNARRALEAGDKQKAHTELTRAQDVVSELIGSLDMEAGGELAANLYQLYRYMYQRLVQANIRKSVEPIDEVVQLMGELRDGWYEGVIRGRPRQLKTGGREDEEPRLRFPNGVAGSPGPADHPLRKAWRSTGKPSG